MYEPRSHTPISRQHFVRRMAIHVAVASAFIAGSLLIGMAGYAWFERLSWLDAFLNAAMLMGGMGPVESPQTPGGKLFAGFYALYCGLIVLIAAAIILAPAFHRFLHRFHLEGGSRGLTGGARPARSPRFRSGSEHDAPVAQLDRAAAF